MDTQDFICPERGMLGNTPFAIQIPQVCCGQKITVVKSFHEPYDSILYPYRCVKHCLDWLSIWKNFFDTNTKLRYNNQSYGATCACGNHNEYVLNTYEKYICYNCR